MDSEREYLNHVDLGNVCHIALAIMTFSIMLTTYLKWFSRNLFQTLPVSHFCILIH